MKHNPGYCCYKRLFDWCSTFWPIKLVVRTGFGKTPKQPCRLKEIWRDMAVSDEGVVLGDCHLLNAIVLK